MSIKDDRKAAVAQVMAELRAEYQEALPGKLTALGDAIEAIRRESSPPAENMEEGIRLAHRLRGTAGSFGFGQVSESSGAIEQALVSLRAAEGSPAESWEIIDQAMAELRGTQAKLD